MERVGFSEDWPGPQGSDEARRAASSAETELIEEVVGGLIV